ncbi:hypothetical protein ACFY7C_19565 [Streptomyces sp. NPDC012769]|uniref:hypothetical protein n=1 Tax=Streptomyces sp. NPDC012769 TaxID=3364848 RepID=UPI00368D3E51
MAISHVNTQTATNASATSLTVTKPTGTASGDLLTAVLSTNYQTFDTPSGWTKIGEQGIETFLVTVFQKVAGGSEPANYSFQFSGSPAASPMLGQVSAWRGIDESDPLDIDPAMATSFAASEPLSTPDVTGGQTGRLIYLRAARRGSSAAITFTASSVTEIADTSVSASGSYSYNCAIYMANSDYSTSGTKSGLAITASATETHNITLTMGLKPAATTGSVDVDLPSIPDMTAAAEIEYPGTMDAVLPRIPDAYVVFEGWNGATVGILAAPVPIDVSVTGTTLPLGSLSVMAGPIVAFTGETRRFADNVLNIAREERWHIITQDGWVPGIRDLTLSIMSVELPSLGVQVVGEVETMFIPVSATANNATVAVRESVSAAVSASVTANNATVRTGRAALAGHVSVSCHQ